MKIIFSPSKEMRDENILKNIDISDKIIFEKNCKELLKILKTFSKEELAIIMKINSNLLENTFYNIHNYEKLNSIPALSLYNGVAFKELELKKYSKAEFDYINNNLFILSAFYGISRAFSPIKKYRLDMTIKILETSLYEFWRTHINNYIIKELTNNDILINLASNEFSKILDRKKIKNIINIDFKEFKNEKYVSISSYSKQARGAFLNIMIKNKIDNVEELKKIVFNNYELNLDLSNANNLIYTR